MRMHTGPRIVEWFEAIAETEKHRDRGSGIGTPEQRDGEEKKKGETQRDTCNTCGRPRKWVKIVTVVPRNQQARLKRTNDKANERKRKRKNTRTTARRLERRDVTETEAMQTCESVSPERWAIVSSWMAVNDVYSETGFPNVYESWLSPSNERKDLSLWKKR